MVKDNHFTKPYINITFHKIKHNKEIVSHILAGIEEESVLWKAEEAQEDKDAIALAYSSADESTLGVGVAVDSKSSAAVHLKRLSPQEPLFYLPFEKGNKEQWRILGSHAARVVKGLPFKESSEKSKDKDKDKDEMHDLTALVTRAVLEILKKGNKGVNPWEKH